MLSGLIFCFLNTNSSVLQEKFEVKQSIIFGYEPAQNKNVIFASQQKQGESKLLCVKIDNCIYCPEPKD